MEQCTSNEIITGKSLVTNAYFAIALQTTLKLTGSTAVNLILANAFGVRTRERL